MTSGCDTGSGDPSPNPHTQRGLLLFLFPLNFSGCLELWLPEHGPGQLGRWDTAGCGSRAPQPLLPRPPPRAQPIHPGCRAAPGFRASLWSVRLLRQDGSLQFWFCQAPGHAILRGRHGERVLLGPGKLRAGG